jgi:hypothetical protein
LQPDSPTSDDHRADRDVALRAEEAGAAQGGEFRDRSSIDPQPEPLTGKAATQERILAAASELFLTRGYENTTIAQVAARAEVSRATVFWHFSDKESLFRECFNRICGSNSISPSSRNTEATSTASFVGRWSTRASVIG